jgi:hypothetical protein
LEAALGATSEVTCSSRLGIKTVYILRKSSTGVIMRILPKSPVRTERAKLATTLIIAYSSYLALMVGLENRYLLFIL